MSWEITETTETWGGRVTNGAGAGAAWGATEKTWSARRRTREILESEPVAPRLSRRERILRSFIAGRLGAFYFLFTNFVSFLFLLLVCIANRFATTTVFALLSVDINPNYNLTRSFEIYRADNYTSFNPKTQQNEMPRYLYLAFSGVCNVFENNGSDHTAYSRYCTQKFVQPIFIPDGTWTNGSGAVRTEASREVDYDSINRMWTAAAALTILLMLYNAYNIIITLAGRYDIPWKYTWPFEILITIPAAVLVMVALTRAFQPIDGAQIPRWGVSFNKTGAGQCLGLGFFMLALLLTFVAHPVILLTVLIIIFSILVIIWTCCCGSRAARAGSRIVEEWRAPNGDLLWRREIWY
ncbi:hypothetical protein ABW19_dt0209897 [Dactylella cylindrospora]|nr:hypothetical protein ABW19_dt0209897 [Dactylella cylindrospora]